VTEALVFLNGDMIPASQAHLAIYDAGVVQGATVTEMTRTFAGRLYRPSDHLDRLFRSLSYTRIDIGIGREQLVNISQALVEHNYALHGELCLVHFVTAGEHAMYAAGQATRAGPTICAHTFPLAFERWADKVQHGARLVTPSIRHVPPECYDPKMKCRSRMHFYLAEQEAQLVDPEAGALLLDLAGNATETSTANFLVVEHGEIVTPTLTNTLPGVSRATVRELAGKLGIPFVERDMQVFSALNADEAWLASTPYCLMPVTRINGVPIGSGRPGPMFSRLMGAWSEAVGVDIVQQILDGARQRQALGHHWSG
jgi:branched-subunit amino acid aminotransferase/4-amino-4-deoxychorismate lyase